MKKYMIPLGLLLAGSFVFYTKMNAVSKHIQAPKEIIEDVTSSKTEEINFEPTSEIVNQSAAKQSLIAEENLAKLFVTSYPINGFFGKNNYRIEYFISEAKSDELDKSIIRVVGKTRHKKVITNFVGNFTIDNVVENPLDDKNALVSKAKNFKVSGTWNFAENKAEKFSGAFAGKWVADISKNTTDNSLSFDSYGSTTNIASENGLLMNGNWISYTNPNMISKVAFTQNIESLGNKIFKDFISFGERESELNPKYAKYGWDGLYNPEEWWLASNIDEKTSTDK